VVDSGYIGRLIWNFDLRERLVSTEVFDSAENGGKGSKGRSRIVIFVILTGNCILLWIGFSAAACLVELRF
jgi:hypothetical protein